MDWLNHILNALNEWAGLFALLALLASVIVPCIFYCIEQRNAQREAQDELDAINDNSRFPMSMDDRNYYVKKRVLEKKARKQR